MANVKSRLKAPKSASTKKRRSYKKTKLTGAKDVKSQNVVMKRPSNLKFMTDDEKVQYLLQNGHILKEKYEFKPPVNVGPKKTKQKRPSQSKKNKTPESSPESPTESPTKQKYGPLVAVEDCDTIKAQCDLQNFQNILKSELMINENKNKSKSTTIGVDNNNDDALTDQNTADGNNSEQNTPVNVDVTEQEMAIIDKTPRITRGRKRSGDTTKVSNNKKQRNTANKTDNEKILDITPSEEAIISEQNSTQHQKVIENVPKKTRSSKRSRSQKVSEDLSHSDTTNNDNENNKSNTTDNFSDVIISHQNCEVVKIIDKETKTPKGKSKKINGKKDSRDQHVTLSNGIVLTLSFYECDYCKKSFNRKTSLRRHIRAHLGVKPYPCAIVKCGKKFSTRNNMEIHLKKFHDVGKSDPDLFVCHICEKPFLVKENLVLHLSSHVKNENSYKCVYCDKKFSYNFLLMQHEKQHLVAGRYQCTLCTMSYDCRTRLYCHVKSHLQIKDWICQYCGKEFLRCNSMKRHVEIFHGGHRIQCPICHKNLKGHLTEHMRVHENKKPHKCPDCSMRFTQSTQLTVHRRSHTGARPYPCRICDRPFTHSNALMLHIRRHTGERPFPCTMCPLSFSQLPHMKTHLRKIHGKHFPYKCPKCPEMFKLKAKVASHLKTCTAEGEVIEDKPKTDDIEVESPMTLSRMRFLLALLFTIIANKEKLKYLGFNKRLIDHILDESLEAMGQTPCKDETISPLKRLRKNIQMLLNGTVPKEQMEKFKNENKSTEELLELLTSGKQ